MGEATRIQDHGIIGDGRSAALVTRSGEIDWLCWPRFDSDSIFASLLDMEKGGSWTLRPPGEFESSWRYLPATNVLETRFSTANGTAVLTDWMPALEETDRKSRLLPVSLLLRMVRCLSGRVDLETRLSPRPAFGRLKPQIRPWGPGLFRIAWRGEVLFFRSSFPVRAGEGDDVLRGSGRLEAGDCVHFALGYDSEGPAAYPPGPEAAEDLLERTGEWWRQWIGRCTYSGPWREEVHRSLLVLKLLQYSPTGAVIAAPTTSLPEKVGGDLNWDYRFCWLRDAAFTIRAFLELGYREEAEAFNLWLLTATRTTRPEVRVLYDLFGEGRAKERVLADLAGYRGSRPVRKGNEAKNQFQLDVYGEVLSAVAALFDGGARMDRDTVGMLEELGEFVCRNWESPDHGIWEWREEPRRYTHSLALGWTALDRLLAMEEQGRLRLERMSREHFLKNRALIAETLRNRCWNPAESHYAHVLEGDAVDASLLLMSWYGFERADSPRMRSTCDRIRKRLQPRSGLLYRSEKSLESGEGAFGICGFWLAEFLARGGGTPEEARTAFADSLAMANSLGLMAEEADPETGEALGNFPQAFSHVGLINAALSLARREQP